MNQPLFRRFTYELAAGHSVNINIQHDWIKCARTAGQDPRIDTLPVVVSLDGATASPFPVGLTINPPQPIKTARITNPNEFAVQAIVLIGSGGVQDDGIIFSGDSGLLPVSLPEDATVRVDTDYHNTRPIKTTNSEIQNFEQRNPNQIIDRASGRVIMPPRARSLRNAALLTGALRERGALGWNNGFRGDQVAVNLNTLQSPRYASFYTPEFIGQARVFGRNPTRKKLTIKAFQHGLLVSRVPFVLPRPQNQAVFAGGQIRYDDVDEYADAVLCVMGGFRPSAIQLFNPFSNNLGATYSAFPNHVVGNYNTSGEAFECDIANTGGLVNGVVPPNVAIDINTGLSGYQGWGLNDAESDSESSDADGAELIGSFATATTNKGLYVNAGGTMWLQEGETMVIEDHAPVYCLGCDQTLPNSTVVVNTLYNELSQFTWTEEFYAATSLTG